MNISDKDALHICNICFHFGCSELAFKLLGSNVTDWKNPETLLLAIRLVYDLSNKDREVRKEIILDIEEYIEKS